MEESDKYLMDRSIITLINVKCRAYLKSEDSAYLGGSMQQIVYAGYAKNESSVWRMIKIHVREDESVTEIQDEESMFIKSGDYVKFVHMITEKYLHSHNVESPLSKENKFNEVSCYGSERENNTDENDYWKIYSDTEYVETRTSHIKLLHVKTGMYMGMRSPNNPLAPNKLEVYTSVEAGHENRYFMVEDNRIEDYFRDEFTDHKTHEKIHSYKKKGFIQKIVEYNKEMYETNKTVGGGTSYASSPLEWLLMKKGVLYWNSSHEENYDIPRRYNDDQVIYLTGNPLIWKTSSLIALIFPIFGLLNHASKRKYDLYVKIHSLSYFFWLCWMVNYLPFFFMERELYMTHYLFSLYFAIILMGYLISRAGLGCLLLFVSASVASFLKNYPLNGMSLSHEKCVGYGLGDLCETLWSEHIRSKVWV
jgi:dolichyl-phosphate-mannose-protein mannosyltransferase